MNGEIDTRLEQIAGLLDQALASDDERVKDALRALLTVTVLCSEDTNATTFRGPFKTLVDDIRATENRIAQLEHIVKRMEYGSNLGKVDRYGDPPWMTNTWDAKPYSTTATKTEIDKAILEKVRNYSKIGKI